MRQGARLFVKPDSSHQKADSLEEGLSFPLRRPLLPSKAQDIDPLPKPSWLKIRPPAGENYQRIKGLLRENNLHTVCEEAHCPNLSECWASGTATIMLGGEICTRACRFCAVKTARRPPPLDPLEPVKVARSIAQLNLRYVVLTSVDRDDLADGGASHFAATVQEIKKLNASIVVETLVPDFRGDVQAVALLVDSDLDVYAHNVETTKGLQYRVRDPRAGYEQSLGTLIEAKRYACQRGKVLHTKSSLMLGFGETQSELLETFEDLRKAEVDVLTLGQYLRPSLQHLPIEKYWSPEEFEALATEARKMGFLYVAAGPMVRSSYRAAELFIRGRVQEQKKAETG